MKKNVIISVAIKNFTVNATTDACQAANPFLKLINYTTDICFSGLLFVQICMHQCMLQNYTKQAIINIETYKPLKPITAWKSQGDFFLIVNTKHTTV